MPANSLLALGSFSSLANSTACEVSSPTMPARICLPVSPRQSGMKADKKTPAKTTQTAFSSSWKNPPNECKMMQPRVAGHV